MKLYTYYTFCPNHRHRGELELVRLWEEVWNKAGIQTQVLGLEHAMLHADFPEYHETISEFPTINSKEYERACFDRWMALAAVGGGWMADYDVFPNPKFKPETLPDWIEDRSQLNIFQSVQTCPSLVYATGRTALVACHTFADFKCGRREINGKPHCSDMYMLYDLVNDKADWITTHNVVKDFRGTDDWDHADVVHFNNSGMAQHGLIPKYRFIPKLLTELK